MSDKANFFYNQALKYFEDKVGKQITFSNVLDDIGKKMFNESFKGVYPVDKIPEMNEGNVCIINVDTSNLPGSHWIGCGVHNNRLYVYDSFGRSQDKLKNMYSSLKKEYKITEPENDPEQSIQENNCGQRSLSWIFVFKVLGPDYSLFV